MKKIFFIMAMAAMVAVSCTKDDATSGKNNDNQNEQNSGNEGNQPNEQEPAADYTRMFEDFENNGMLSWTGADGATFEIAENPSKAGVNKSDMVGKVTAGGAKWEFTWSTAFGGDDINFVNFSEDGYIVRVDVYSPKINSPVYLKFEGVDVPSIEITNVTTTKANEWETLEFDYEPHQMADGAYKNFVILFDAGVEGDPDKVFYFDNVRLCIE